MNVLQSSFQLIIETYYRLIKLFIVRFNNNVAGFLKINNYVVYF